MGSPHPEADDSVIVARVIGPHGSDGGLNIHLMSDLPGRFDVGRELLIDRLPYLIADSRQTGPSTRLILLEGIPTRHRASSLTGKYLSAHPEDGVSLEEGEYYHYQLIGMKVITEQGEDLGEIQEILETGSNDVYIVQGGGSELLIPATVQVVIAVDVAAGSMLVRLPDGLR